MAHSPLLLARIDIFKFYLLDVSLPVHLLHVYSHVGVHVFWVEMAVVYLLLYKGLQQIVFGSAMFHGIRHEGLGVV